MKSYEILAGGGARFATICSNLTIKIHSKHNMIQMKFNESSTAPGAAMSLLLLFESMLVVFVFSFSIY